MAIELVCGNCHGRLLVETPGSVVACPHCGVHLHTAPMPADAPAPGAAPASKPAEHDLTALDLGRPSTEPTSDVADFLQGGGFIDQDATRVDGGVSMPVEDELPAWVDAPPAEPAGAWRPPAEPSAFLAQPPATAAEGAAPAAIDVPLIESRPAATDVAPAVTTESAVPMAAPAVDPSEVSTIPGATPVEGSLTPGREQAEIPDIRTAATPVAAAASTSRPMATTASAPSGPSPVAFKMLLSYASAVTVACLYLAYLLMSAPSRSPCLDLPDLKVHEAKGKKVTTLIYVDPITPVYRWHRLKLGETRNYGPINVTPLRVTRGPLEFEFFNTEEEVKAEDTRRSSQPVLKLHLRIENVSENLEFAPLDRALVFTKEGDPKNPRRFKANNFICAAEGRRKPENFVWMYDLPPDSLWNVKDQNLDRELKPHETMEAFLPTTEEKIETLSGDLVWRFHFRRGYNQETLHGVTSLIEVAFNTDEIVDESPPEPEQKPDAVEKTDGKT